MIAMEFSPADKLTALGMIIGLITSIIASFTSIKIARENKAAIKDNTDLTKKTSADVETVKKDVDGMKSKDAARIAELEREAAALKQQLAEAKQERLLLAQSAAASTVVHAQGPVAVTPPAVPAIAIEHAALVHLGKIDENTAATAENTKRTETKMDAMKDAADSNAMGAKDKDKESPE